jgi:tetratricopeptide (TPR) repeat protein
MNTTRLLFIFSIAIISFLACSTEPEQPDEKSETPESPEMAKLQELSSKIEADSANANLYFQRAQTYYELEGYDQALADLQKAMMIDSTQPAYYHLLADTYLDYFKSYNALHTMEVAAQKFPDNIHTLLKLSEFQFILKKYQESYKTIDQILRKDPQNSEAYFMMGLNLKEQGDTIRSINAFQSSVENDPDNVDAWLILGQMYAQLGDRIAEQYFDNAIRVDTNNMAAWHAKADYYYKQGKTQEALDLYRQINIKSPTYEDAYYNAGIIYMNMDSLDKAKEQFDILIKTSPIYIMAYFKRGQIEEIQGNLEAAKKDYKQTLTFAPQYEPAKEALERLGQ